MIYIIKQEGLYQNKVNSSLVITCNCKMGYFRFSRVNGLVTTQHLFLIFGTFLALLMRRIR